MKKSTNQIITGTTQLAGVIGWPIHHSMSPIMQNAAFQNLGLDVVYIPLGVSPEGLRGLIHTLKAVEALGANVTIPHKERVIRYLDEVDNTAAAIGAVNTIVIKNRKAKGYNTDVSGFMTCVKKRVKIRGKSAVLLGGGGAGRAIAMSLVFSGLKKLLIVDTDQKRLQRLLRNLGDLASFCMIAGTKPNTTVLQEALSGCDLLVNATPLGLKATDSLPIPDEWMPGNTCVMDLVYGKGLTGFLHLAKKKQNKIIPGWEMLLYQGADAFKLWTNRPAPVSVMEQALLKASGIKK